MTQNDQNPLQQYYQYDGNAPNYQTNNFASVENTPQNVNPQNFDYNKNAYANPVSMGHPNLYSEGIQQQHNSMPQYVQNENYFNEYSNINQTNNSSQIRNDFQTFPSSKQEPKNSPSKIINDSKALNEPSNQIDYLQVPNFPDQENSYVQSKTNNQIIGYTTGPECDIIQSPKIFQDFVGIDKGFSTHKFCRLSFPNWAKNLISKQSFSSSDLPLIFSITPFAELSKRENKVPVIDRKKSGPMRCSRCFAYVCPGSKINTLEGSLKCALCNENSIVPSEISIASNSSNELGLGVELSHGTYDMEVGESFLP
ncbi:MAG: COPII coat Sec23p-Sfb3p heterodimer component, partial [Paramarteilia canceri]